MSKSSSRSPSLLCDSFLEFLCSHSEDSIPHHTVYDVEDDSFSYDLCGLKFMVLFSSVDSYKVCVSKGDEVLVYGGDVPFVDGELDSLELYRVIGHGAKPLYDRLSDK